MSTPSPQPSPPKIGLPSEEGEEAPFVSDAELEQGWKDVPVRFRTGKEATIRVNALSRRACEAAVVEWLKTQDAWEITGRCVTQAGEDARAPNAEGRRLDDQLELASAALLDRAAFELCLGRDFAKKKALLDAVGMKGLIALLGATLKPDSSPRVSPKA